MSPHTALMRRLAVIALAATLTATALSACSSSAGTGSTKPVAKVDQSVLDCIAGKSALVGPNGEKGTYADKVTATADQMTAAKKAATGGKIAISTHFASDYTTQVVDGIKKVAQEIGATVITTDAGSKPQTQISDIESLIAQKPALLVIFPVDAAASAPDLKAAADANVPVVVVGSALEANNYSSLISAYDFGGGLQAASQLVTALGGKGDIAVVPYKFSLWHVDNRVKGFEAGISCAPGIKIVEKSVTCQAKADCTTAFSDILTANPSIAGGFGAYDGIAQGMNAAAASAGWKGFVTTSDLGLETAQLINSKTAALRATSAQITTCQGSAAGTAMVLTLAKADLPKVVFCKNVAVDSSNVGKVYEQLFGAALK